MRLVSELRENKVAYYFGLLFLGIVLSRYRPASKANPTGPDVSTVSRNLKSQKSNGNTTVLLTNGRSAEFSTTFSVNWTGDTGSLNLPDLVFQCDDKAVLDGSTDCATQVSSTSTSSGNSLLEVVVDCTAERFPGKTVCKLSQSSEKLAGASPNELVASPTSTTVTVSGLAFYDIENSTVGGEVGRDTEIYSGIGRSWKRDSFDAEGETPIRFGARIMLPNGQRVFGEQGNAIFNEAMLIMTETDALFLYDAHACQPGNFSETEASQTDGVFELAPPEACGFGTAPSGKNSDAVIGLRLRPFKSGQKSVEFYWWDFGFQDEQLVEYTQILSVQIGGRPPPVVKDMSTFPGEEIRHSPCEGAPDIISVQMYNVNNSTERNMLILNSDGEVVDTWREDPGSFSYISATDTATSNFTSRGGSGRNVPYAIVVMYSDAEPQTAVFLPESAGVRELNFSLVVSIDDVFPTVVQYSGGVVLLRGSFFGYDVERDSVQIDSSPIDRSKVRIQNSTHIEVQAPPQENEGEVIVVQVQVVICSFESNKGSLVYGKPPSSNIMSLDVGSTVSDSKVLFELPPDGHDVTFLGQSGQSDMNLTYSWQLTDENGREVPIEGMSSARSILALRTSSIPEASMVFNLSLTISSLAGNDTSSTLISKSASAGDFLAVALHTPKSMTLSSAREFTSVYASVRMFGRPLIETNETLTHEWLFRDKAYVIDEVDVQTPIATFNVTGPTMFGQEFIIAKKDLMLGPNEVSLRVHTKNNPSKVAFASASFMVDHSNLIPVINHGINGDVIDTAEAFTLSGSNSHDPDEKYGITAEGEKMTYEWISCFVSDTTKFSSDVVDCQSALPSSFRTSMKLTIPARSLRKYTASKAVDAFVEFGLQIRRGNRSQSTTLWFRLKSTRIDEKLKTSGVDVFLFEDSKGSRLDPSNINHLNDIILRPNGDNTEWLIKNFRSENMTVPRSSIAEGSGLYSLKKNGFQTLPLMIHAGMLAAKSVYYLDLDVRIDGEREGRNLVLIFRTITIPRLSCTATPEKRGIAAKTEYTVFAHTEFENPGVNVCFFLVSSPDWIPRDVGFGCSPIPFAKFMIPTVGTHFVSCEQRSYSGLRLSSQLADVSSSFETSPRLPGEGHDEADPSETSAHEIASIVHECFRLRNHVCLKVIGSYMSHLVTLGKSSTENLGRSTNLSEDLPGRLGVDQTALQSSASIQIALTEDICQVLKALAFRSLFTPNTVQAVVRQTYFLSLIPKEFIDSQSLLDSVVPLSLATEALLKNADDYQGESQSVDVMRAVVNTSISKAGVLMNSGTNRKRLNSWQTVDSSRALFALLMDELPVFLGYFIAQQENCGFESATDSSSPGGSAAYPPSHLYVRNLCDVSEGAPVSFGERSKSFRNFELRVCPEIILSNSVHPRLVRFPLVIRQTDARMFCESRGLRGMHTVFINPTMLAVQNQAVLDQKLPPKCIDIRIPRVSRVACNYSSSVSDFVANGNDTFFQPLTQRQIPQVLAYGVNIDGGTVTSLGNIRNASLPLDDSQLRKEGISVIIDENWVQFRGRRGADFIAGHPQDPGIPAYGESGLLSAISAVVVCGLAVVVLSIASSNVGFVAGIPQRTVPDDNYTERDLYGRVLPTSDLEHTSRCGRFESTLEAGRQNRPISHVALPVGLQTSADGLGSEPKSLFQEQVS